MKIITNDVEFNNQLIFVYIGYVTYLVIFP